MDKTMIKIKDKETFVFKREYIEDTYKNLNTKDIAIETIKKAISFNSKRNKRFYTGIDLRFNKVIYAMREEYDIIPTIFSIYIDFDKIDFDNDTLDDIYYKFSDSMEFYLDKFEDKLNSLYNNPIGICELCGGNKSCTGIEEELIIEIDEEYRREYHINNIVQFQCDKCKNKREIIYV